MLVTSGLIHLHLWDIAYRHVKTLDVLFLVQVALCLLAAVTLLFTRHLLVVLGAAVVMVALTGWLQWQRRGGSQVTQSELRRSLARDPKGDHLHCEGEKIKCERFGALPDWPPSR